MTHVAFAVHKVLALQLLTRRMLADPQRWPFRPVDGTFAINPHPTDCQSEDVRRSALMLRASISSNWGIVGQSAEPFSYTRFDVRPLARTLRNVQERNGAFGLSADCFPNL